MFIAIPVGMNYRTERMPLVTLSLIGINTLIWLVTAICFFSTGGQSDVWVLRHLWLVPGNCQWYAPLTSMFVHANIFHILGNMIFLFLFGACVEDLIGRLRFIVFYLVGGLMAEMAYIALLPAHFQSPIPMGGASGAISACMGMYLLLRAGADIEFKYFLWLFFVYIRAGEFVVPAWVAIICWFGKDLLFAVLGYFDPAFAGGVAFGAHVGGFLGGLALVAMYLGLKRTREKKPASGPILDTEAILAATPPAMASAVETSETPTLYVHDGRQQTGPFTLTQVQTMLRRGEIGHDASYWSEGMSEWQSVVDLAGQPLE
jgi:membrane associated rhomboid family serine protease